MLSTNIADLNVLLALCQGPKPLTAIIFSSKSIAPDMWQPTTEVICLAIDRCLKAGFVRSYDTGTSPGQGEAFRISRTGRDQLAAFVKSDPDSVPYSNKLLVELFQISVLERLGLANRGEALPETGFGYRLRRIFRDLSPTLNTCHRRSIGLALGNGD